MVEGRFDSAVRRVDAHVVTGWFIAAVTVLLVNDHLLKSRFPGPLTGKLSDLVGPVVVAGLLAVAIGRRRAVATTALGFAALKLVPGVAEAAAPFMGGLTQRDPWDLVGLVALAPLWIRPDARAVPAAPTASSSRTHQVGRANRAVLRVGAPVVAMMAFTATSSANPTEVRSLATDGKAIYAQLGVRGSYSPVDTTWAMSVDSGHTWTATDAPAPEALAAMTTSAPQVCDQAHGCVAARGIDVAVQPPGELWTQGFSFTSDQVDMLNYRRFGGGTPVTEMFESALITTSGPTSGGGKGASTTSALTLVTAADQGVLVRSDGGWQLVGVLGAQPTPTNGAVWPLNLAVKVLLASGPLALVAIGARAVVRGGGSTRVMGNIAGASLVALAIWAVGLGIWGAGRLVTASPVLLAGALLSAAAATVVVPTLFVARLSQPDPV